MDSGTCRILLGRLRWENVNTTLLKLWRALQVLRYDMSLHDRVLVSFNKQVLKCRIRLYDAFITVLQVV